jgi:hypothetical protein
MTDQHPITPPPELVREWQREANHNEAMFPQVATLAAQWGADQELEACCEWLDQKVLLQHQSDVVPALRAARRPKPLSLKEQALAALRHAPGPDYPNAITLLTADEHALIRRALEQLND